MIPVTRTEALALVPDLVALTENPKGDFDLWEKVNTIEQKVRKGQAVIVVDKNYKNPRESKYFRATVSLVKHGDMRNEDGPVIRVQSGNVSWRVDGNDHFSPVNA